MKEGCVIRDQNLPHFLTATIVDWIDFFSRKSYRDCIIPRHSSREGVADALRDRVETGAGIGPDRSGADRFRAAGRWSWSGRYGRSQQQRPDLQLAAAHRCITREGRSSG